MIEASNLELGRMNNDWRHALAKRAESVLTAEDIAGEVAQLPPLEAYYILRDIGPGQALPILLALSPEQLMTCVDLDCWSRHDFTADSLDEWLTAFSQAGPEALAESFFSLDYVVQLLFLAQTVTVFDPDTDEIPPEAEEDGPIRAMTPDGFYLLELKTELKLTLHPFTVLDALYQYDLLATHQLLSEVRVDLAMQIEEEALRLRNGRMEDLGFVSPDEAVNLFSRPGSRKKPSMVRDKTTCGDSIRVPSVYANQRQDGLLAQALSLVTDHDLLAHLEQELVWTINTAIIAYGEKTQDTGKIADLAKRVCDTISLGLESLLVEDGELHITAAGLRAVDLLGIWEISELFKHGFAASLEVQKQVKSALEKPEFREWFELATAKQSEDAGDLLDRAFITALLGRHPLWGGFDMAKPDAVKAFAGRKDLTAATLRLQQVVTHICPPGC